MPDWHEYLTPEEEKRLDEIALERRDLKAEYRRIYERCYKRMIKDGR